MKNLLKLQAKIFAITVILLISISGILLAQNTIAIINAGSTGSRLHVYKIKADGKGIDIVYPTSSNEAASKGRALSSVADHVDSVKVFLNTMTSKYSGIEKNIPLYVLATAGMRLIKQEKTNPIYKKLNDQKGKVFNNFCLDTAMTISGRYEGFYAWIAANYKNGRLGFSTSTPKKSLTYTGIPYGILEIGGASMQIAFAVNPPQSGSQSQLYKDCISREGFSNIYSISYLGGGADQVYGEYKKQRKPKESKDLAGQAKEIFDKLGIDFKKIAYPYDSWQFLGLGTPIKFMPENMSSLVEANDTDDMHPWMNAHYITWVTESLKLKAPKPIRASDWTEGAALDILINRKKPEGYNYNIKN